MRQYDVFQRRHDVTDDSSGALILIDAFETMIALPGARLLRRPNDGASVVANLKWNVLTMREAWDGGPWIAVRLDDGRSGFVRRALARSPIDYRAWFRKREGKWRMEGFLAGD